MADLPATGPLRSAAFRFALLLAAMFAAGSVILLYAVDRQIGSHAVEATRGSLRTEATILAGEYAELGQSGLTDAIERHSRAGGEAQFRYLLTDTAGRRLAGDLPGSTTRLGWTTIVVAERESDGVVRERLTGWGERLPDGLTLVVATDNFDVENVVARLEHVTIWAGLAITLFALFGGYLIGRAFVTRLARVNRAVNRIVDGDRSERLPPIGFGPEFDVLTHNLNRMLDRNDAAMEALRQVSSDIAHDLRTPLTRLNQRLEAMRDAAQHDPAAIDAALDETNRLLSVFQALLRIGTMEGGVGRQRFARIDLTEVMDRVFQAYHPVAEDGGHLLLAEHARGIGIDGDAELIAQLLTNLIENAIVHTPTATVITSRLHIERDAVVIEVCDTGPGIPADQRTKVFRRFYRLDASRNSDGAGLGLALVAAVAGLHKAVYEIIEDDSGRNCIRIRFPKVR